MSESSVLVPRHVGFILDGNRRWAREHKLPLIEGHRQGYQALKKVTLEAFNQGVEYVSAYVFSTENWKRGKDEVAALLALLLWVFKHELATLNREGVRLKVIGSKARLGKALLKAIHEAEKQTENNTHGTLVLCLNYGGQQEVVDATKRIVAAGYDPEEITPELISKHVYAPEVPPVDFIVRASGEQRLSNFMTWRSVYSELLFTKAYWPDFGVSDLHQVLQEFAQRQRRFGN